ncbi:MAG TPA: MBG domain-containing protein [Acidobacteriaceae bacterium]
MAICGLLVAGVTGVHAQISIGAYAGQPGITPNTSPTVTHVCASSIPLNGNSSTKLLGSNIGDGCSVSQILVSKPNATQIDSFGQLYISDGGNYTSNTDTGDSATYTTPTSANSYTGSTPGPGYTGELRVLYNGTNAALGTALVASYASSSILASPVPPNIVYNVIGGGQYTASTQIGAVGYTTIFASAAVAVDASGNIFEEGSNYVRMTYVAGTQQASFLAAGGSSAGPAGTTAAKSGYSYVLINSNTPGTGYFGDGGYVLLSQFNGPKGMAVDANGNLYVADSGNNVVREINIAGASTDALGNASALGYVTGVVGGAGAGCAEATVSKGTYTSCTSVESGDGGPARSANLSKPYDLAFDSYGNLYIADYGAITGRVRVVYLGSQPPAGYYATAQTSCTGMASTATTGTLATCKDIYTYAGGGSGTTAAAATSIKLSSATGIGFDASNNLYIADAVANQIWEVTASTQNAAIVAGGGSSTTEAACSTDGYGDGCVATNAVLSTPTGHIAVDTSGNVYFGDSGNNVVRILKPYSQGTMAQTITFPAPTSPVAYGAPSIGLGATASSGLPVTYNATGPATLSGNMLTFTGTGTVVITASQAGNAIYAAATPVQQSIVVNTATLTVTPSGLLSRIYGTANPTFGYTITGFISPDTQANSVTGSPLISTTAVPKSPVGSYPITVSQGTLVSSSANNYGFALTTGATLSVTGSAAQSIIFPALANYPSNDTSVQLAAYTTSGLPATYAVASGPATVSGSTLYVTGTGAVSVTASQAGNTNFAAATPVTRSFTAQPTSFVVYDNMFYSGKPTTSTYGLITSNVVYESKIWVDSSGTTQADEQTLPTRSSFDTLMAKYTNPGPLVLDVELLGLTSTANEQILATLATWAKADHPGKLVGYYGYNTFDNVSTQNMQYATALGTQVTAMFPSMYTYNDDQAAWASLAAQEVAAARAIAPGKPVYIYISPQYHPGTAKAGQYVSAAYWAFQLQTAYSLADGVVIWSSSSYAWDDSTGWWEATQTFMQTLN